MKIEFVAKEKIYPAFGMSWPERGIAHVRADLPPAVRLFVSEHELYHLCDPAKWWVWREIKANAHAALRHPWGFFVCVAMSLAPYRLKYYFGRLKRQN